MNALERTSFRELNQSLHTLQTEAASRQSAKTRSHQVPPLIHSICSFAYENGIPIPALVTLLDIVTLPNHLDQPSLATLIKGLYPAAKVPSTVVCLIVNSLGQGKPRPSPSTQNLLLRWLVMVYEVLEDTTTLFKLYGALFGLLDMIGIRANLCHLLSLLTQRKHVKPFRIQYLLELSRSCGGDPALLGLLKVYKNFYPDVIVGESGKGRVARLEHPDPEWRDRLRVIQDANLQSLNNPKPQTDAFKVVRRGAKRSRVTVVPEVITFRADESSITLEEVDGVFDFVENFDKIALPNQLVSALEDPLFRKYVLLKDDATLVQRMDHWLSMFFDAQLQSHVSGRRLSRPLIEVLEKALTYTHYTKSLPLPVSSFLSAFIDQWDGTESRDLILSLLAYLPTQDFHELQHTLLSRLETAILDNTPEASVALLEYYTALQTHWTAALLSLPEVLSAHSSKDAAPLSDLVDHASLLALALLASYPSVQNTISAVVTYHEALADTVSNASTNPRIRVMTPFTETIYLLVFLQPSISTLSRLCSVLATYKRTFEIVKATPLPGLTHEYPRDYVSLFNGFLMDICNLIWRSRAFNTTDTNALGCLMPPAVPPSLRVYVDALTPPQTLQSLFSLSNNPSLSAVSIAAFQDLEESLLGENAGGRVRPRHAGPATQRSLEALAMDGGVNLKWADYRREVLKWLGERGVEGIGELMFCTMKDLMKAKSV